MGGSFDDRDSGFDAAGKRPAPTIEGTATEVSVEPSPEETKPEGSRAEAAASPEETKSPRVDTADEKDAEDKAASDTDGMAAASGDAEADDSESLEDESDAAGESVIQERAPAPERRSFASALLSGLVSLFTHALAGLIGGLAVLGAIMWGYLPAGPSEEDPQVAALQARIGKLEAAPKTTDNTETLAELKSRVATLETTPSSDGATPADVETLSDRVAQLEARLKSMADGAKDGGSVADAAAISQQVAEAEKRLDAKIQSEVQAALANSSGGEEDAGVIAALKAEIATLDAKLKALTEAELGAADAAQLAPEVASIDERLGRIEATLPSLLEAVDEENAETKKATIAIAFANLREAVSAGRPYASELSTLSTLSPGTGDLGSLLDYEENGIPTVRSLTQSFEKLRDEALAAQPADGSETLVDQILGSAQSLVKVKRIDEMAKGDSRGAVLSRAAAQLNKDNLEGAVTEVEKLQGPPAEVMKDWLEAARARLDAEVTLRRLQDILLVSIAGPDPAKADEEPQDEEAVQE